jgi:lipopolysaccharide transport system ATP-binding protein
MSKPIIEAKGVSKRYRLGAIGATRLRDDLERFWHRLSGRAEKQDAKDFWALREITFDVQSGDIVGIMGRNGAGKSTLLKVLSRITEPTDGEIILRGRVASLLEVGTGFQPDLTGRENVFLNGAILGMTSAEIRSKFDEIVEFAEIEKFIDTPVKRYSSGMYVRLAFAVAAHLEPEILIVDEVLAVGDVKFQNKCLGRLQELSKGQGRTVLFVSHNVAAMKRLCTRGVFLSQGTTTGIESITDSLAKYVDQADSCAVHSGLEDIKRQAWLGNTARFCSFEINSGSPFEYGKPTEFTVEFTNRSPINCGNLSVQFDSPDNQKLLTLDSDVGGQAIILPEGRHRITMKLDRNPLTPGNYSCTLVLHSGIATLDFLPRFATVECDAGVQDFLADRSFQGMRMGCTFETTTLPS